MEMYVSEMTSMRGNIGGQYDPTKPELGNLSCVLEAKSFIFPNEAQKPITGLSFKTPNNFKMLWRGNMQKIKKTCTLVFRQRIMIRLLYYFCRDY